MNVTPLIDSNDISRYSRQLILPEFGVLGQRKLRDTSILIVGCGGLGCPSALYLAAAGVGILGLLDYDEVELSNLHRQILHCESDIGIQKCTSAAQSIKSLNSTVQVVTHNVTLDKQTATDIVGQYDVILDCTDNVVTRYLLNDTCVLLNKPLVSGSALRFEGQLTVYHYKDGPCYRCLFPTPPPASAVTNCSEGGVLGVIPGVIGVLQALEAIKVALDIGDVCSNRMLFMDGLRFTFRTLRLRGRNADCIICGESPRLQLSEDYLTFCGSSADDKLEQSKCLLKKDNCLSAQELHCLQSFSLAEGLRKSQFPRIPLLVDVRPSVELQICHFEKSCNIDLHEFRRDILATVRKIYLHFSKLSLLKMRTSDSGEDEAITNEESPLEQRSFHSITGSFLPQKICSVTDEEVNLVFICRRGNDSQIAISILLNFLNTEVDKKLKMNDLDKVDKDALEWLMSVKLCNLTGGIWSWAKQVESSIPKY